MSTDKQRGLYGKFLVERTDGSSAPGGKHEGCEYFVLDVTHDPHAKAALAAYAESCREAYPLLTADLRARWLGAESPTLTRPDGWPLLTKLARVGNGTFGPGISTRLVVEAAQRAYQYAGEHRDLAPEQAREAERTRRQLWDKLNGPLRERP